MPDRGYFRMDLTDNCNIRCIMCQAYNWMPVNTMRFIDFDRFVEATRGEIGRWQVIQLGNVAEATIHPRFPDFVRYIRREAPDSEIRLVTNGRLLHKFAPLLNDAGNVVVQVSMDSIRKETHEYIRAGSEYQRAVDNISLIDLKRNQVILAFTLMAANIEEYPEMVKFCQDRGYQMGAFPMILRTEAGILPLNLLRESLWFHIGKLQTWLKQYYGVQYGMMVGTATGAAPLAEDFECNAHESDVIVDAVGNLNLCGKVGLGTLVQRSLQELWHSDQALRFRDEVNHGRVPCMTCNYRQRCLSPSMALLDNHFSEPIVRALPEQTKRKIAYDRSISDEEAMVSFIAGIHDNIGLFDIQQTPDGYSGRQVIAHDGRLFFSDPISTATRHELHARMREISVIDLDPTLVEEGANGYNIVKYSGWFWALPQSLGHVNLSHEGDQRKPGIKKARTLLEARDLCFKTLVTLNVAPKASPSLNASIYAPVIDGPDAIEGGGADNMTSSGAMQFVTCGQPLDHAAKSRAEAARTMVKAALSERDRYLEKYGLEPEIWSPAANWDLSQPFYENSRWLFEGGDPAQLRPRSYQFTGRRVPAARDIPDVLAVAQYRNFHEHLPEYLQISPAPLLGESGWMMDGVIVNYDTMAYWERLAILYQTGLLDRDSPHCLKPGARILEIGGGFGSLGRLLRKAIGNVEYTILDLPESLIYSAIYLSACFEDGFRFIPNYRFRELAGERFDLVINTLSMSEMSEKQVRAYCQQLAGMTPLFFEQNHDCRKTGLCNAQDIISDYFPARLDVRNREGYTGLIQGFAHIWSSVPLPPDMDRIVAGLLTSTAISEFPPVDGYRVFSYFGIVCAVPAEGVDFTRDFTQVPGSLSFESLSAAQAHLANLSAAPAHLANAAAPAHMANMT